MTAFDDGRPRVPGLLSTILGVALIRAALLALGYARARRLVDRVISGRARRSAAATRAGSQHAFACEVADQVVRASVFFPGRAICLEQSLALYALLRQRGVTAELRLAVQPFPFTAHAWVDVDGAPVNETEERTRHFHLLRTGA